jgi:hypothetical protein
MGSSNEEASGKRDEDEQSPPPPPPPPQRYLVGCGANASRRWREHMQWREEFGADKITFEPQPNFDTFKESFPTYFYGRSKLGHLVFYEQLGHVDVAKLTKTGLNEDDLARWYVFVWECMFGRVAPDPVDSTESWTQMITVEDVQGIGLSHLTPRVRRFISSLTAITKPNYVERCHRTYIINAPLLFRLVWRVIEPIFDARTRSKISILGYDYVDTLKEDIDVSEIPEYYGGSNPRALGDSDDERKIAKIVKENNNS